MSALGLKTMFLPYDKNEPGSLPQFVNGLSKKNSSGN